MSRVEQFSPASQPVVLGRVAGLYGVRGWVRLHSYTDPRETILDYANCLLNLEGRWQPAVIEDGRRHGKTVVAKFAGIDDRDAAAACVGADVGVPRERMPEPDEGHYYWVDLVGLRVEHKDGTVLGIVGGLLATGANDVLVVKGDREILIPFVRDSIILDVDRAAGVIRVDWEWD